MPTYDYVCDACDHAFEEFQSMTAKVLKKCPECGKLKLRRLIGTGAGVIFKGGGFYETDYRSESYSKDAKADKPAESTATKSDDKSSASADSKTEAKTASTKKDDKAPAPAVKSDSTSKKSKS